MNEDDNKVNAITGETNAQQTAESVDWKQKYEHQMEVSAADSGRMKKLAAEKAQLERELAELRASRREEELVSSLSEDERAGIPEDVLKTQVKLASSVMTKMREENERRFREMENERSAEVERSQKMAERNFIERIDARFPKFRSSIGPGGDKAEAWSSYLRYNKPSIQYAYGACDFEALSHHIETFYRDFLGTPVPSVSSNGSAASDPETHGGSNATYVQTGTGKTYTSEEYLALYDKVEEARRAGNWEEKRRIEAEISNAPREGRVKDA